MSAAISTDYMGESKTTVQIRETLQKIAEAGFTHIHWCDEWDGDYVYSVYEMLQIREWMEQYGLKAKALHASKGSVRLERAGDFKRDDGCRKDYTSFNEYNRLAGVELLKNRVDMAVALGASEVVLHMLLPFYAFENEEYKERYYGQVYKSLDELEYYCRVRNVRVCIENMWAPGNELQTEQFDRLFLRYGKEFLGMCLDTGHALLADEREKTMELAERFRDRIYCVHLSDNFGRKEDEIRRAAGREERCHAIGSGDAHKAPFDGVFDWDRFARILSGSPFELPVILETSCRGEEENEFLRKNLERGERFQGMVMEYRKKCTKYERGEVSGDGDEVLKKVHKI